MPKDKARSSQNLSLHLQMMQRRRDKMQFQKKLYTLFFIFLVLSLVFLVRMLYIPLSIPAVRISKDIKTDIHNYISAGNSYETLKAVYDSYDRKSRDQLVVNRNNYYERDVGLTFILEEMREDEMSGDEKDFNYIERLTALIAESKDKHPFDRLEENQQKIFKSLRDKSGENYSGIRDEVIEISNILAERNETLRTYLGNANIGFYISVIALILTLVPMLWKLTKILYKRALAKEADENKEAKDEQANK